MPRMSKKKRLEMTMFINSKGRIEYNRLCKACSRDCKQSHRAIIILPEVYAALKEAQKLTNSKII